MAESRVQLRPLREEDLPDWVEWLNDPEVTTYTLLEAGSCTLEGERAWFAAVTAPDYRGRNWQLEVDGRHIGGCSLELSRDDRCASFGIIIGHKPSWGKGHGTAALRETLRIGFEEMNLHRIDLDVFAGNTRGLRCYEKCGFRREGLHRAAQFKRGRWIDRISMAILREEWEREARDR